MSTSAAFPAVQIPAVMAIDPGYENSAWVVFNGSKVLGHGIIANEELLKSLTSFVMVPPHIDLRSVVIETIESYGMAVGRETFETMFWIGRFYQAILSRVLSLTEVERMTRKTVKVHLCQSARAQDSNIRTAITDRFGGKAAAIGTKKQPGPLYGIKSHEWSALAIALTWWDLHP